MVSSPGLPLLIENSKLRLQKIQQTSQVLRRVTSRKIIGVDLSFFSVISNENDPASYREFTGSLYMRWKSFLGYLFYGDGEHGLDPLLALPLQLSAVSV